MECNKDEAINAKTIAENKLAKGDYKGAQKIARRAQQLYPDLENILHLLAVCDVHCAAETKILGSEMNWYGILQVEQFADDAIIKKQYRKLALLLHPDKNQIAGAEAAFKLVGEANGVLTDQTKRVIYDMKFKSSVTYTRVMPGPHLQTNGNSSVVRNNFPSAPQSNVPNASVVRNNVPIFKKSTPFNPRAKRASFWTRCQHCGSSYQHPVTFMNVALRCQSCHQVFVGHDVGPNPEIDPSSQIPLGIPTQPSSMNVSKRRRNKSAEESAVTKKSKIVKDKGKKVNVVISDSDDEPVVAPNKIDYPDPEFNDFEKDRAENCFAVDQVWAVYDDVDTMPRFYARVDGMISPGFKLMCTWLEPKPGDQEKRDLRGPAALPIGCGDFVVGGSHETDNRLMFSHQMHCTKNSEGTYALYPRKGETWALYKDVKRSSITAKHKTRYQFEYAVVSSNYVANSEIGITHLSKVEGFVYLFQKTGKHETVPPSELYRFSHRVPSVKMTGTEKDGVPEGSFELDPGSLMNCADEIREATDAKTKKRTHEGVVFTPIVLGLAARNGPLKNLILRRTKN